MLQPILIFSVLCVGCFIYYKITMQRVNAKVASFDKQGVQNNIDMHTSNLLNSQLEYLKVWMKNKPVDAFTDASIAISIKDKAKNAAIDTAKKVAWRAVGVRARYHRVDVTAHLVLSNDELHFLSADVDGDLNTHITFTKDQLNNARIEFKGAKKSADLAGGVSDFVNEKMNREDALVNVFAITIRTKEKPIIIQAHDKMILTYVLSSKNRTEDSLIANLVAENFFKKLSEKYPNLTARKMKAVR